MKLNLPKELTELNQWVVWKKVVKSNGKTAKIPFCPNNMPANVTRPGCTSSYEKCLNALNERPDLFSGLGFVLMNTEVIAIDIDGCFDGGPVKDDQIRAIIHMFKDNYMEVSPSGTGIRIICTGSWPKCGSRTQINGHSLEVYKNKRFVTITGASATDPIGSLTPNNPALLSLWKSYFTKNASFCEESKKIEDISEKSCRKDEDVIQLCLRRRKKFSDLYVKGNTDNYGGDCSRADLALCTIVAAYTRDHNQINRIFRSSKLYRKKWDRDDYREGTIMKAIMYAKEFTNKK